jgi:hypothetical protein
MNARPRTALFLFPLPCIVAHGLASTTDTILAAIERYKGSLSSTFVRLGDRLSRAHDALVAKLAAPRKLERALVLAQRSFVEFFVGLRAAVASPNLRAPRAISARDAYADMHQPYLACPRRKRETLAASTRKELTLAKAILDLGTPCSRVRRGLASCYG